MHGGHIRITFGVRAAIPIPRSSPDGPRSSRFPRNSPDQEAEFPGRRAGSMYSTLNRGEGGKASGLCWPRCPGHQGPRPARAVSIQVVSHQSRARPCPTSWLVHPAPPAAALRNSPGSTDCRAGCVLEGMSPTLVDLDGARMLGFGRPVDAFAALRPERSPGPAHRTRPRKNAPGLFRDHDGARQSVSSVIPMAARPRPSSFESAGLVVSRQEAGCRGTRSFCTITRAIVRGSPGVKIDSRRSRVILASA